MHPDRNLGWRPTCPHGLDPIPATVLDPFCGSGTTLVVAEAAGRRGIGLDLSREYLDLARHRIDRPHARPPRPGNGRTEVFPLFDGPDRCSPDGCDSSVSSCPAGDHP